MEGDIFRITVPLPDVATATVGPTSIPATTQVGTEVTTQVKLDREKLIALVSFCSTAKSRKEMQEFCGIKTAEYFRKYIIKPMITEGLIKQTIPDKPNSRNQKYIKTP